MFTDGEKSTLKDVATPTLAQLREKAGLTQTALSDAIGTHQFAVSSWEGKAGKKPPTVLTQAQLLAYQAALGVTAEEFVAGLGDRHMTLKLPAIALLPLLD